MSEIIGKSHGEMNSFDGGQKAVVLPQPDKTIIEDNAQKERMEKRKMINEQIENELLKFESGGRTKEDFESMVGRIVFLREDDYYNANHSWTQDQVNRAVNLFEKYNLEEDGMNQFHFAEIFTANPNFEKNSESVNDLAAKALTERIENGGERLPYSFDQQIRIWSQNIHTVDKNIRFDLLYTMIDNPATIDNVTADEAVNFMVLSDPKIILDIKEMATGANADICKTIKNIMILRNLSRKEGQGGFKEAALIAKEALGRIEAQSESFFVKSKAEEALTGVVEARNESKRLKNEFDDIEIKQNYPILPACAQGVAESYAKNVFLDSVYGKLNNKYAVIYNPDHLVDSFFELSDDGESSKKGIVKRLTINEILEREGLRKEEMEENDYKKMVLTYKSLIELPLRSKIEKDFNIELRDYSVREQVQFVNFLSSKSVGEVGKVIEFLDSGKDEEARKNRVKSFLLLEQGRGMSDKIFGIGRSLEDQETADAIFAKYAEIVDLTGKVREELGGMFKENREVSQKDLELISQNLIWRANKLLVDFSNKIKITKDKGNILAKLENYQSDLVLTASVYKSLKQSGEEIKLEDFNGVSLETKTANEISPDELRQMLKIYGDNYGYNEDFKKILVDNLDKKIKEGGSGVRMYVCKKDDRVVVFNGFEDRPNGKKHGFAYNAIESMQKSSIGKSFLKTSLEMETADGGVVEAECDPRSPNSSDYVEKFGFVVTGATDNYQETGEPALNIEKSADSSKYDYKKYSEEQIIAEQGERAEGAEKMVLRFQIDTPDLLNGFLAEANKIANNGYVMTRYVFSGGKGSVYCAFEKVRG